MKQRIVQVIDEILESMAVLREAEGLPLEERVHSFRKSGKRVRALLELLGSGRGSAIAGFRKEIAAIARTLSTVRDRHVSIRTAHSLRMLDGVPIAEHRLGKMISSFLAAESSAIARDSEAIERLFREACDRIVLARKEWIELAARAESGSSKEGLEVSYRQGRKVAEGVLRGGSDSDFFHELRKVTKRLGYQADWLQELNGWPLESTRTGSKELGDQLGEGLDLTRLAERLEVWAEVFEDDESDREDISLIVKSLLSEGMKILVDSLSIASRLYFRTGKEFRRDLGERDSSDERMETSEEGS